MRRGAFIKCFVHNKSSKILLPCSLYILAPTFLHPPNHSKPRQQCCGSGRIRVFCSNPDFYLSIWRLLAVFIRSDPDSVFLSIGSRIFIWMWVGGGGERGGDGSGSCQSQPGSTTLSWQPFLSCRLSRFTGSFLDYTW